MTRTALTAPVMLAALLAIETAGVAQQAPAAADVTADINALGSFSFSTRTEAAGRLRRAPVSVTVPALQAAARAHADSYTRFRSLVLLSGTGDAGVGRVMRDLVSDRDDRVRTVVYEWFERHPDSALLPTLLAALPRESSEFVRPALTRAIAAHGDQPAARDALLPLVTRGEDVFRGSVIRALGIHRRTYALGAIEGVAKLDGPLQDDAIAAIAEIGAPSSLATLSALKDLVNQESQPIYSASLCLLNVDCQAHLTYLTQTLAAAIAQHRTMQVGQVVQALSLLAIHGRADALTALTQQGMAADDPERDQIALGVALVAVRVPEMMVTQLIAARNDMSKVSLLVRDGFDLLSEDFSEECFYVEIRRLFWEAAEGSDRRRASGEWMTRLEF